MGTSDPANPSGNSSAENFSDSTVGYGEHGGAAQRQIGPYRLLQRVGEGGMGEVWLAEQKTPIHRNVALKLIKAGMDTKAVVARFESERQALALMDHPNIARVFDAGSTPEGRPYFVMEFVAGLPLTEYCDKHRLTVRQRLELFAQVCDGVQHAHQKAIIHRDLKPSNVLVLEQNDKAVPKIIDFGLAKAVSQRLTDKTFFTEIGVLVGTPEYMSPEQADLVEQNVDTRTDVYSLGLILYELLVGALPFDAKTLRAAGLEAILRVIREQEPPKPSTKVRQMGVSSADSAERRQEEPRSFARHLEGELDWITMKAIEKDRSRRYGTANELSADLARYLQNQPVVAGPATAGYRIRKYAARHRFGLGAAAGALVLLAGFVVAQAFELRRVRQERDRADRERDRASRVTDFMTRMFQVSDPSEQRGNSITAREILDKAAKDIDTGLAKDAELQAQMSRTMGNVYFNLGLYTQAQSLEQHAREILQRTLGPDNPETMRATAGLARIYERQGRYGEAEALQREALDAQRRVLGPQHKDTLNSMNNLAVELDSEGHFAEAEKLARETLEERRRALGPADPDTVRSMNNLAMVLDDEGHYAEAEKLDRETLELQRRILGPENPDTFAPAVNLANVLRVEGQYAEAEKLNREMLGIMRRVLGPEHPNTLLLESNLAAVLYAEDHYAEAEKLDRETLEIRRRVLGPNHPATLTSAMNLADVLRTERHYPEAEKLSRETLEIERSVLGPEHPLTLLLQGNLATVLSDQGRYSEAEKLVKQTREVQVRVLGADSPYTASSTYHLACIAAREGRRDEAISLLREAVDHGLPPADDLEIEKDPDLKSLKENPQFKALIVHAKERAAGTQTTH